MQLTQLALLALPLVLVQARPQGDQDRQLAASPDTNLPIVTPVATLERRRKPAPPSMRATASIEAAAQASGAAFKTSKTALLPSIIPPAGASVHTPGAPATTRTRRPPPRSVASQGHHFPSGLSRIFPEPPPPHPTFDLNLPSSVATLLPKPTKKVGGPAPPETTFAPPTPTSHPGNYRGHGKPDFDCGKSGHHPCN